MNNERKADEAAGLVERLRASAKIDRAAFEIGQLAMPEACRMAFIGQHLCEVAADLIESLTARVAELTGAVDAEREACALICDTTPPSPFRPSIEAAHAIRQRAARG